MPTFAELGYPEIQSATWFGLYLPAGAPRGVIARIHRDVHRVLTEPDFRDRQIVARGNELVANSPEEFAAQLRKQSENYADAVKILGTKAE